MYTDMEMWRDIRRRVLAEGESKCSICTEYGIHFWALERILGHPSPLGYQFKMPRPKRKIGPYLSFIHDNLEKDKKAPRKQRHTAKRILDCLVAEHGYAGGVHGRVARS